MKLVLLGIVCLAFVSASAQEAVEREKAEALDCAFHRKGPWIDSSLRPEGKVRFTYLLEPATDENPRTLYVAFWNATQTEGRLLELAGCGGSSKNGIGGADQNQSVQGAWEITLPTVINPDRTGFVEANLVQSGNTVTSAQVEFFDLGSAISWWDMCYPSDLQTLSATVKGNVISGTVSTCDGSATFTGTIARGTISGTYIPQNGEIAGSSYSFSATQVQPLSGTYAGSWGQGIGSPQASVILSESASGAMTVTGTLSNLGTVSLSGTTVANAMVLQGNANGVALTAMAWVHGHTLWIVNYPDTPSVITLAKQ